MYLRPDAVAADALRSRPRRRRDRSSDAGAGTLKSRTSADSRQPSRFVERPRRTTRRAGAVARPRRLSEARPRDLPRRPGRRACGRGTGPRTCCRRGRTPWRRPLRPVWQPIGPAPRRRRDPTLVTARVATSNRLCLTAVSAAMTNSSGVFRLSPPLKMLRWLRTCMRSACVAINRAHAASNTSWRWAGSCAAGESVSSTDASKRFTRENSMALERALRSTQARGRRRLCAS